MHGVRRVIVFCLLTTLLPIFLLVMPLYLRHSLYADVIYAVTESDIMEITDGVSTMFCSSHTLQMNGTFNAFQMGHRPEITSSRKHIRLKKSMTLPDDTLEYWGFYLLRGATVALSVCSRFPGASILVVKGERSLRTCGMLDHNRNKARTNGIFLPQAHNQVKITFETNAQEIDSKETKKSASSDKLSSTPTPSTTPHPPEEPRRISPSTMNRLSPSVQNYLQRILTENATQLRNSTEKRLRHKKKRLKQKSQSQNETSEASKAPEPVKIDEKLNRQKRDRDDVEKIKKILDFDFSTTQKNYYFERKKDYEHQLSPRLSETEKEQVESLKSQLLTEDADVAAEEDEFGAKIFISHKYVHTEAPHSIKKRNQEPKKPPALLDRGIKHGGNAFNVFNPTPDESSVSSFEEGLWDCYKGRVILAEEFPPSDACTDVHYLATDKHMETEHNVTEDGYYYYIFYSDNDIVFNDIHAVFNIYKPTFQYENVTKSCVNQTECTFPLGIMSNDRVIVEIPTRDGIEHEADDISLLISVCHPRVGIYVIFPIAVLFLIISCAFL